MNPLSPDASAVFFAAALQSLLSQRRSPDTIVDAYASASTPVPLIVDDPVFGSDTPQGLLLWLSLIHISEPTRPY